MLGTDHRRQEGGGVALSERLGEEANLNRTYFSAVELSQHNISNDNLYRVAKRLGVEAHILLTHRDLKFSYLEPIR